MPIYEFKCDFCKNEFEEICLSTETGRNIECPKCNKTGSEKLISKFAFCSDGKSSSQTDKGSGCSSCATHNCSSCGC